MAWCTNLSIEIKHFVGSIKINTFTDTEMFTVHKNKYTEKLGIKENRVGNLIKSTETSRD